MNDALPAPAFRPLFSLRLQVDRLRTPGGPAGAARRVGDIANGVFEGDRLHGHVLPGGSDWQTERGDGAIHLDARLLLQTFDDALIAMTYVGLRHGPADVMAKLAQGEPVDPATYYFRIVPSFATSDPRYEWLNRVIAIGCGERLPTGPVYRIHELL